MQANKVKSSLLELLVRAKSVKYKVSDKDWEKLTIKFLIRVYVIFLTDLKFFASVYDLFLKVLTVQTNTRNLPLSIIFVRKFNGCKRNLP